MPNYNKLKAELLRYYYKLPITRYPKKAYTYNLLS